jgi:hypothetical protein
VAATQDILNFSDRKEKFMDSSILVAIITVSGSILVAAITFYLTKRHQLNIEWQHEKLNHYKVLLSAISYLAIYKNKPDALEKFSTSINTIALIASQNVVSALMNYCDAIIRKNEDSTEQRLNELFIAIRKDIGLSAKDNMETFKFHLIQPVQP